MVDSAGATRSGDVTPSVTQELTRYTDGHHQIAHGPSHLVAPGTGTFRTRPPMHTCQTRDDRAAQFRHSFDPDVSSSFETAGDPE
ncbi:MAG: hypothetical protein ABEJ58_01265 [Halodesulfurarchaeum sp.]